MSLFAPLNRICFDKMIAIATLLELSANTRTSQTWQWLESECGLSGIKIAPMPHLSWQVAEEYDLERILPDLERFAKTLRPFAVNSVGLGIFTRNSPVLYYSLTKTSTLIRIHKELWNLATNFAEGLFGVYSPDSWIPHVTLAYKDVTPEKLACGVMELAFRPITLDIWINHFAVIYIEGTDFGMKHRIAFVNSE